jgi:hypothetical protein
MLQPVTSDTPPQRNEPWLKSDLLFLKDSLAHGMSYAEVAGFLGRTEEEVRRMAEERTRLGAVLTNPRRS